MIPQILSNKIILTQPAPGNQRGAVWSESPLLYSAWETDLEFRASGPERGGGKFAIWLAKDGQRTVGTSSIYTVGKFEGLAIVIDNYGGTVCLQLSISCSFGTDRHRVEWSGDF